MKPSLDKLQKFLKLEADRGYDNRAVFGGLERMLDRWEAEARADELPEDLVQAVGDRLRDYGRLAPASRAEVLAGLWRRVQRETGSQEELPPARPEKQPEPELAAQPETAPKEPAPRRRPAPAAQPAPSGRDPALASTGEVAALNAPITVLSGVGPRHAKTLERLGLYSLRDMLYHFPRRYDDYTRLEPINRLQFGDEVTVIGTIQRVGTRKIRGGKLEIVEAVVSDGTGALRITWFNQPWHAKRLRGGSQIVLSGKIEQYLGRAVMNNPEWEPLEQQQLNTNRIVPVYPLTANITQRWLRRLMNQVVSYWAPRIPDPLPERLRQQTGLMKISTALWQAHFPDSWQDLEAARHRLAFDEIFLLQLGVLRQKRAWQDRTARVYAQSDAWLRDQLARLPYALTGAQARAVDDIRTDLASGRPMNRLLQGDVGSGKTTVAALAIGMLASEGVQSALMAPTSILAEQHYKNLVHFFTAEPVVPDWTDVPPAPPLLQPEQIRLLLGATPESEKQEIRAGLAAGSIKLVIGTHALLEDPVTFQDLQLAVIDEQHRFGVEQRSALRAKGDNLHLLVMTATPIPRSLALTLYGDLDLTVIDELPPGRQDVSTHVLPPRELERAYNLIRKQVAAGRQAFVIYPLVEESENNDAKAAVEQHGLLQREIFPRLRVGLLHGRLRPDEKDAVMAAFRDRAFDVLVSTTVVEVGVDIPNATVMLIEGANRFGLAQLHQLRGRVGRGAEKSYCLLVPDTPDNLENERLQAMASTNDGFVLADRDLEQRGPGEFLGTRQAGFGGLQMASLTDIPLIEKARRQAQALFEQDPELEAPEHRALAGALNRFWGLEETETIVSDIS